MKMQAENIFIRLLIDSNYFVIDENTGLINEIHGPSLLKEKIKENWEPLSVDILFFYDSPLSATAFLIFFTRSAGAGVVSAHLRFRSLNLDLLRSRLVAFHILGSRSQSAQ